MVACRNIGIESAKFTTPNKILLALFYAGNHACFERIFVSLERCNSIVYLLKFRGLEHRGGS